VHESNRGNKSRFWIYFAVGAVVGLMVQLPGIITEYSYEDVNRGLHPYRERPPQYEIVNPVFRLLGIGVSGLVVSVLGVAIASPESKPSKQDKS
jgi:hypothetical protein